MEESELFAVRKAKFEELCQKGQNPFRANCRQTHTNKQVLALFETAEKEGKSCEVAVAGRIIAFRLMGKASFLKLLDQTGTLQIYVSNNEENGIGAEAYNAFKTYDIGDFIGVEGDVFRTKTNEITVRARKVTLVSKSFRSLPDKFHGLNNPDTIYR